ncbi:hypothetical protein [Thermoactinospora rubra]|uniref:hypothetical protein n=1 Tax=Thermoactinospora rubra TaxID=1088767 RepID=UPI00117EA546|nr:hypothetical protein [Thermoactinospora rubra]
MTETPKPGESGDRLVAVSSAGSHPPPHRPAKPVPRPGPSPARRAASLAASVVGLAARLAALVLVLHALFIVFRANPANVWYQVVESAAGRLSLGLAGLFQFADDRWEALVNYGLAAVVWLIIGSVLAGILRKL